MADQTRELDDFSAEENTCTNCVTMYLTTPNHYNYDTTVDTVY
jgi:hypothetical protein